MHLASQENPLIPMGALTGYPPHDELTDTLQAWRQVGVTQFLIYARSGCELDYLSEEWFEACTWICQEAERLGFTSIWLYDEFNWPSGTCNKRLIRDTPENALPILAVREQDGKKIFLKRYSTAMSNLFDEQVVDRFIQLTHQQYANHLAPYMGRLIKGFFTDEPDISFFGMTPAAGDSLQIPWYEGLEEDYERLTGGRLKDDILRSLALGERFFEGACNQLYAIKFRQSFAQRISDWCAQYGMVLTGHLMNEYSSKMALQANGHPLKVLSGFSQPGMDEIFTHHSLGMIEWLTLGTVMYAVDRTTSPGGLAELFALGPCDMTLEDMRRQLWLVAAFGVNHYVLAVSQLTMRGNVERPNYFNPMTRTQPWFEAFRELGEEAKKAAQYATEKRCCKIAVRYPYTPAPLTELLKHLTAEQLSWQLVLPDEETDAEAILDCRRGMILEERSGRTFFDAYCWLDDYLKSTPRQVEVLADGELARELFLREFANGHILVIDFSGQTRRLTLRNHGSERTFTLQANGVTLLTEENFPQPNLRHTQTVQFKGTMQVDRRTTCRADFNDSQFAFEALEELPLVTLAIRQYGALPQLLLDGRPVQATAPCHNLPQGFRELYGETEPFLLTAGHHVLTLVNQAPDYPYLPTAFVLGKFFRSQDMNLGTDPHLGLHGYAGKIIQEASITIPEHASCLELDPQGLCTEVLIDGISLGKRLWHPFQWTLPEAMQRGTHSVKIIRATSCGPLFGIQAFDAPAHNWLKHYAPHNEQTVTAVDNIRFLMD